MLKSKRWIIPVSLMVIGAALIVLGVFREETRTVLQKAMRICLECIGIG